MDTVKDALRMAIQQGAPVYNQGRPDGCYDIYRAAASTLLESGVLPSDSAAASTLRDALQASALEGSADAQAWRMRRAFDSILDGSCEVVAEVSQRDLQGASDYLVLDATKGAAGATGQPNWFSLDDVIMGGVSSSSIRYDDAAQALVFAGNVTTDSNGGFASVRSAPWAGWAGLSRGQGMRLLVQGDGRVYKVTAKTDEQYDGVQYQHDFLTGTPQARCSSKPPSFPVPNGWQVVDLPFRAFTPNFRGRPVRNQPPLAGSQIRQLGLMVSKFAAVDGGLTPGFRNGSFRLALRSIHAFI